MAIVIGLSLVAPQLDISRYGGIAVTVVWISIYRRRLHDIGRSAWWQVIPLALSFGLAIYGVMQLHAPTPVGPADGSVTLDQALGAADDHAAASGLWILASLAVQFVFTVVLGVWPGPARREPIWSGVGR